MGPTFLGSAVGAVGAVGAVVGAGAGAGACGAGACGADDGGVPSLWSEPLARPNATTTHPLANAQTPRVMD